MECKYLRVTIHDNDFSHSLKMIGELLYELFWFEGNYPTEEQFPMLKEYIKHLWYGANATQDLIRLIHWEKPTNCHIDCFEPHLEFVDYSDIPDWDNSESIYIPMFEGAEVLMR